MKKGQKSPSAVPMARLSLRIPRVKKQEIQIQSVKKTGGNIGEYLVFCHEEQFTRDKIVEELRAEKAERKVIKEDRLTNVEFKDETN